ncbi:MAG: ABC transporter permease [Clostridia bacterium]|nr:ABC transporter permease [Clostridia bacterium]NCC76096.1 ABC transporter permease [Clostridia bacterium]
MTRYILQRAIAMILTLFAISTITFFLMHAIPGGPFTREKPLEPAIIAALNEKYHLDDPLFKQYTDYMGDLMRGDFGPSFKFRGRTVNELIGAGFPITAKIGILAVLITVVLSVPMGIISALKQTKWQDYSFMFLATLGVTVPGFVLASVLIYVFCVRLGWFPVIWSTTATGWLSISQYILPMIALSGYSMSFITRLMRSSMLDVIGQDYIRTARAKGLSEMRVIMEHALKNAILPVVTYLGPTIAALVTGSFVIEKMFTIPGIGYQYVDSIGNRDYTMIMGSTIFYAAILIILNFLVDIIYGFIDPRIKIGNIKEA